MALTDLKIKKAKPDIKPYRLFDGNGLYILVSVAGGKSWQYRYKYNKEGRTHTLGEYPIISLKLAR